MNLCTHLRPIAISMPSISAVRQYPLTTSKIVVQEMVQEYLSPLTDKSASTTTQKYSLCFLNDLTYDKWIEVFDA